MAFYLTLLPDLLKNVVSFTFLFCSPSLFEGLLLALQYEST